MKIILGILGVIASIIVGLYVGVYVMFIGGIVGIFTAIGALITGKILVGLVAISVIKIMLSALLGWISFAVLFLPSWLMIMSGK